VEVLQDSQGKRKHNRRHTDVEELAGNRSLDWASADSDIKLFPHSPLAFADVLRNQKGVLNLVPAPAAEFSADESSAVQTDSTKANFSLNSHSNSASVTSIHNAEITGKASRRKRRSRDRYNLLTLHPATELQNQCKKVLVENALIKQKGDRQLYLVAGFINWEEASNVEGERKRAPLLSFPALLVRSPLNDDYEVRFTGDVPEFNEAFAQLAEQRFGITLPAYEASDDMSDYFVSVAESIRETKALELEFDIALGSASLLNQAGANGKKELPDVPPNFDIGLAMSIARNKSLHQLNAVLQLIPSYGQSDKVAQNNNERLTQAETVAGLRKYAARLAAEGLDHVEFRQLNALPVMIKRWGSAVKTGLETNTITSALQKPRLSARELIRLSSIIELVDKAPDSLEQLGHSDLCYANTTVLLHRAQHQAKLIEDELAALQEHFILDKVPAKSQLLSLMNELSAHVESDCEHVESHYFNARRQFMEFCVVKQGNFTANHKRMLSQLVKVLRFRELFVNNTEYRAALGPGYKGLRTDWTVLSQISDYARELTDVLESETIAANILGNWEAFRSYFCVELDTLQFAADGCRRLLGTVGTRWQTQAVESLVEHAEQVSHRLEEWHDVYGSVENHALKTPAMVLSSFSGQSREDVVVETQVDDTRSHINKQLESGEISRDQIADTVQWLLEASHTAKENEMDIEAIVDHLQIA